MCVYRSFDYRKGLRRRCNVRKQYSYNIDEKNTMTIWENNAVLCTISDVRKNSAKELFKEVVYDMRKIMIKK